MYFRSVCKLSLLPIPILGKWRNPTPGCRRSERSRIPPTMRVSTAAAAAATSSSSWPLLCVHHLGQQQLSQRVAPLLTRPHGRPSEHPREQPWRRGRRRRKKRGPAGRRTITISPRMRWGYLLPVKYVVLKNQNNWGGFPELWFCFGF